MFQALVLSGGSFKGISYIGIFRKLEETGIRPNIQTISACSVGTIFGLLWILGFQSGEMQQIIQKYNFAKLYQFNLNTLFDGFGCSDFQRVIELLTELLTLRQLSPAVTFQQLYNYSPIRFITNAVCLETGMVQYFDYCSTPEMPVLLAIQMSCAIPLLFPRVIYRNQTYIDGGVLDHLPLECLNNPTSEILCINLSENLERQNLTTFSGYLMSVIKLMTNRLNETSHLVSPEYYVLRIHVPINLLDMLIDSQQLIDLIDSGYQQTTYYFALWKIKYNLIFPCDQPKKVLIGLKFK